MLLQQKEAVITLISAIVFGVLLPFVTPLFGELRSEAILLTLVLFILVLWVGRIAIGARFKALDERDRAIRYQAAMIAMHFFGAVLMVFACVLYLIYRSKGEVPLYLVLQLAYYCWMALYVFWGGSMLVLHKTGTFHV